MRIAASSPSLPHGLLELLARGRLAVEIGLHPPLDRDPVVHVEEQGADPVVELAGDAPLLLGEQPVGNVGGRHRVVAAGKDDLVQPAAAELGRAVAGVRDDEGAVRAGAGRSTRWRPRGRRPGRARPPRGARPCAAARGRRGLVRRGQGTERDLEDLPEPDEGQEPSEAARPGARRRSPAAARRSCRRRPAGRPGGAGRGAPMGGCSSQARALLAASRGIEAPGERVGGGEERRARCRRARAPRCAGSW